MYGNPLVLVDQYGLGKTGAIIGRVVGGIAGGITGGVAGAGVGGAGGAAGGTLVAPGVGTVGGGAVGAAEGAAIGATAGATVGAAAGAAVGSAIEDAINAISDARSGDDAGEATQDLTDTDNPRNNDPCRGLRRQLKAHEDKLRDYTNDPDAHDNKDFLKNCPEDRRQDIIDGRIRSLQNQIENFSKQLRECERANGL